MRTAALAQRCVVGVRRVVKASARAGPIMQRGAQLRVTGVPHRRDMVPFPTRFGDGGHPRVTAQRVIIALSQRPCGVAEHRGGNLHPTPGSDRRIDTSRCSPGCPSLSAPRASARGLHVGAWRAQETQAGQEQHRVGIYSRPRPCRDGPLTPSQHGKHLLGGPPRNPVLAQDPAHAWRTHRSRSGRRQRVLDQAPEPR